MIQKSNACTEIRTWGLCEFLKDGEIVSRDRIDMKIEEIEPIEEEIGSLKAGFQNNDF